MVTFCEHCFVLFCFQVILFFSMGNFLQILCHLDDLFSWQRLCPSRNIAGQWLWQSWTTGWETAWSWISQSEVQVLPWLQLVSFVKALFSSKTSCANSHHLANMQISTKLKPGSHSVFIFRCDVLIFASYRPRVISCSAPWSFKYVLPIRIWFNLHIGLNQEN